MDSKTRWRDLSSWMNPGWKVDLGRDAPPDVVLDPAFDNFVYLVDTSTFWIAAGMMRGADVQGALGQYKAAGLTAAAAADAANLAVLECGESHRDMSDPQTRAALTAGMCAVAQTRAYEVAVAQRGEPRGHWVWLVYRLRNGDSLGRPLYGDTRRPGFMNVDRLKQLIAVGLANDIASTLSVVAAEVRSAGGALLDPGLERMFAGVLPPERGPAPSEAP